MDQFLLLQILFLIKFLDYLYISKKSLTCILITRSALYQLGFFHLALYSFLPGRSPNVFLGAIFEQTRLHIMSFINELAHSYLITDHIAIAYLSLLDMA